MTDIDDSTNELSPMDFSMCGQCKNLMVRVVLPMDMESFGIDEKVIEELNIADDESIEILYYTCLVTNQDMDYVVIDCNHFKDKNRGKLINDPYTS
jgi:hypothetical protein